MKYFQKAVLIVKQSGYQVLFAKTKTKINRAIVNRVSRMRRFLHKYQEKAQITLERDGFTALLIKASRKIKDKIRHLVVNSVPVLAPRSPHIPPLQKPQAITLKTTLGSQQSPRVSILIYAHNQATHTYNCLAAIERSMASSIGEHVPIEIILVNDASTDETSTFLEQVSGIQIVANSLRLGRINSFNQIAKLATGDFCYFLDHNFHPTANWLENLLFATEKYSDVGVVGNKIVYENVSLHSAGGIVWQDATLSLYGDRACADEPEYNYVRSVDFCPAIALLVRRELFQQLDGFCDHYDSVMYAIADFCFAIRQLGYKVFYQPKVKLVYRYNPDYPETGVELSSTLFSSWEESSAVKQTLDQNKFASKWHNELVRHLSPKAENLELAARRLLPKSRILIIDTLVPAYDKDSGSNRLFKLMQILQKLGYHLIFLPDYGHEQEPYTSELESLGIEVLYFTHEQSDWQKRLQKRLSIIDIAWVCRPELCEKYIPILHQKPDIKVIYDTIDLHFLRLKRQWELLSAQAKIESENEWQKMQALEVQFARTADVTVVVTEVEKDILEGFEAKRVQVVPNIHVAYNHNIPSFADRRGLLFIGGYYHKPNVDAVIWLCQTIMPLVWQEQPDMQLTLLGSNPSPAVKALANKHVTVPGYIQDVEPYFLSHRLFVAPLRYGAGMKGKIGHSLSYGLPTITTAIGAEGMGLTSGVDALIADEPEAFAKDILQLYNDQKLWQTISQNSPKAVAQYTPEAIQIILARMLESLG